MMDIAQTVRSLIAKHMDMPIEEVQPSSDFVNDIGVDSLAAIELILAAEEEFELDMSDEDAEKLLTVQDAIDYVTARVKAGKEPGT